MVLLIKEKEKIPPATERRNRIEKRKTKIYIGNANFKINYNFWTLKADK